MGYRDTPSGQRQAEALREAERRSERRRSLIVATLPMEHDQYKRYLRGDTPLRWDQIPLFAAAYGLPVRDLSRALGLIDEPVDPVLRERVIDALGPEAERRTPDFIDEVTQRLSEQDEDVREDALRELHEDTHAGVSASC